MKFAIVFFCILGLTFARPDTILDFEGENHEHEQGGNAGDEVNGSYSWTSPEGQDFYVKYVADDDGYRVIDSNAVPVNHNGVAADGNQGSFSSGDEGTEK